MKTPADAAAAGQRSVAHVGTRCGRSGGGLGGQEEDGVEGKHLEYNDNERFTSFSGVAAFYTVSRSDLAELFHVTNESGTKQEDIQNRER